MRIGSGRRERAGPKRHEMAALEVAEHLGLAALHAQKIGGAGHVDVEEGAAHEEVRGFRRHVLGELGEALGGDDAGQVRACGRGTSGWSWRRARLCAPRPTLRRRRRARRAAPRPPPRASDTSSRAPHRTGRRGRPPRSASAPPISRPSRLSTTETRCWRTRAAMRCRSPSLREASTTTWPNLSASVTKSPSGSMMACWTRLALCSRRRRRRCDLPEPELPWTSRRVARSSSRSSRADCPPGAEDAAPMSMPTFISLPRAATEKSGSVLTRQSLGQCRIKISPPQAREAIPRHDAAGSGKPRCP